MSVAGSQATTALYRGLRVTYTLGAAIEWQGRQRRQRQPSQPHEESPKAPSRLEPHAKQPQASLGMASTQFEAEGELEALLAGAGGARQLQRSR